jgi:hypothetical protein
LGGDSDVDERSSMVLSPVRIADPGYTASVHASERSGVPAPVKGSASTSAVGGSRALGSARAGRDTPPSPLMTKPTTPSFGARVRRRSANLDRHRGARPSSVFSDDLPLAEHLSSTDASSTPSISPSPPRGTRGATARSNIGNNGNNDIESDDGVTDGEEEREGNYDNRNDVYNDDERPLSDSGTVPTPLTRTRTTVPGDLAEEAFRKESLAQVGMLRSTSDPVSYATKSPAGEGHGPPRRRSSSVSDSGSISSASPSGDRNDDDDDRDRDRDRESVSDSGGEEDEDEVSALAGPTRRNGNTLSSSSSGGGGVHMPPRRSIAVLASPPGPNMATVAPMSDYEAELIAQAKASVRVPLAHSPSSSRRAHAAPAGGHGGGDGGGVAHSPPSSRRMGTAPTVDINESAQLSSPPKQVSVIQPC